jgi:replicative DNA helicase
MIDTETIILKNLLIFEDYSRKVMPFLKREYFEDRSNATLYDLISDYYLKYDSLPSKSSLHVIINDLKVDDTIYQNLQDTVEKIYNDANILEDLKWLIDATEDFCKNRALYLALMESIDISQKDETDNSNISKTSIPEILSQALSVSFDTNIGHDYIDDSDDRYAFYKEKKYKIPFHISMLNKITDGGIERKTINCIMSPTGGGKTMFMCDLAANYMKNGYNVLYITMEMAEEKIAMRIDSNLMNIEIGKVKDIDREKWDKKVENIRSNCIGKLKIKEYPNGTAHAGNFRYLLKELATKQKFVPDVIVIDYMNICASAKYKDRSNSYGYIKAISEELRALAQESNTAIITATQTNRDGIDSTELSAKNTSESAGGPMTFDFFLALIQTEELAKMNQVLIKQLKSRYGDIFINNTFMIGVDRPKMKFYDIENSNTTIVSPSNNTTNSNTKRNFSNVSL